MVEKSADGRRSRAARTKAWGRSGRRHLAMLNDGERSQAVDGVGYCPRGTGPSSVVIRAATRSKSKSKSASFSISKRAAVVCGQRASTVPRSLRPFQRLRRRAYWTSIAWTGRRVEIARTPFRTITPNTQNAEFSISSEVVMGRVLCAFSKLITKCRTMPNRHYRLPAKGLRAALLRSPVIGRHPSMARYGSFVICPPLP